MHIVTDSGTDLSLSKDEQKALNIHVVPLNVRLDDKTYREGIDIQPVNFYPLLEKSKSMPTTSQPSTGEFADTYRKILETVRDILSIHISSGLSGTYSSAVAAAELLPEANITFIDTKTLSAAAGCPRRIRPGALCWLKEEIISRSRGGCVYGPALPFCWSC